MINVLRVQIGKATVYKKRWIMHTKRQKLSYWREEWGNRKDIWNDDGWKLPKIIDRHWPTDSECSEDINQEFKIKTKTHNNIYHWK